MQMSVLGAALTTLFSIIAVVLITGSISAMVAKGRIGVVDVLGAVRTENVLREGFHFVAPWESVTQKTIQLVKVEQTGEKSITALAANVLEITIDVVALIRMRPEHGWCVVQRLQNGEWTPLVIAVLRTVVREAAARHDTEALVTSARGAFRDDVQQTLEARVRTMLRGAECPDNTLTIESVGIRKITLPDLVREAVEKRNAAQQNVERMTHVLASEHKEAQRKEIEAGGIAKFEAIVAGGISENLLRWKGIDATKELAGSTNAKIIVIGGGSSGLPVISPGGARGEGTNALPPIILDAGSMENRRERTHKSAEKTRSSCVPELGGDGQGAGA